MRPDGGPLDTVLALGLVLLALILFGAIALTRAPMPPVELRVDPLQAPLHERPTYDPRIDLL